jgi:hypothetical protein
MKLKILEHGLSVICVGLLFLAALVWYTSGESAARSRRDHALAPFLAIDSVDFSNPYHRELFRETVSAFFPGEPPDSLLGAIDTYRAERLTGREYKSGVERSMTGGDLARLSLMYLQFIAVYLVTLLLTSLAGKSLAVFMFVGARQGGAFLRLVRLVLEHRRAGGRPLVALLLRAAGSAAAAFVLFSPAYVVAYALKARLDTGSVLFLILLAVLTNGALINHATRFFTLLTGESRKGYVDTARVKNLRAAWGWKSPGGLPAGVLWRPQEASEGHIFRQIHLQARLQLLPALKEHASFLITGLIIIEMALNIQGHLGYELLQNILYRRYDVVAAILFGMFLLVKLTELAVDWRVHRELRRYANEG